MSQFKITPESAAEIAAGKGTKADHGKPRVDLVPVGTVIAIARVLEIGAKKYTPYNWQRGMEWHRCHAAALRHLLAFWGGEDKDPETGESHLAHALCMVSFLEEYRRTGIGVDDRPHQLAAGSAGGSRPLAEPPPRPMRNPWEC